MEIKFKPIGIVHSPFKKQEDIELKRQARTRGFDNVVGVLEIFNDYKKGLKDIQGFSHLIVLFLFHQAKSSKLRTRPPFEKRLRGIFATRSPHRPNPLGMTVVKLVERKGNILKVRGLDMIEGTPILDIKPYTPRDRKSRIRVGWLRE